MADGKVASTEALNDLHSLVASTLASRIRSGEATAADINVARQFLKDNGIEAKTVPGNPLDQLGKALTDGLPFAGGASH